MLTKTDLDKIRKVTREEIESETRAFKDDLGSRMLEWRISIQSDIREVRNRIKNIEITSLKIEKRIENIENDLQKVNLQLRKIDKKHTELFDFLDKDLSQIKARVKKVEENLGISPL